MLSRTASSVLALAALLAVSPHAFGDESEPRSRRFEFTYAVRITGLAPGQAAKLWMPVPPNTTEQSARLVTQKLPGASQLAIEPRYGNAVLFIEAVADAAGCIEAESTYGVTRQELRADSAAQAAAQVVGTLRVPSAQPIQDEPMLALYLQPDARVPIRGKPLSLLEGMRLPSDQLQLGRTLYDVVNGHMRYSKEGTGWGQGDAVWACDSKYGNCSDFHSLFISLARSQGVPAKFEIGFPLPPERGRGEIAGYHCWAQFKPHGRGWVPVDISEASKDPSLRDYYFGNLTENRLTLSVGRDLVLAPPQSGPPLNFFVYPYVEVDGKPYPAEKVQGRYSFADLNETQ